jgi:sialate O-acetylesterase
MKILTNDIDGAGAGTAGETIMAFNGWGKSSVPACLGIGSQTTGQPDWTFATNAASYNYRHLQIFVQPRVYANVPEAAAYEIIYGLEIPRNATTDFNANGVPYVLNNADRFSNRRIKRIAYYLELKKPGEELEWVYISFDPYTQDLTKIGVPNRATAVRWQQHLVNMNVYASAGAAVTTGSGIQTGNIEFWSNNYGADNEAVIPGASGSAFDFGDDVNEGIPSGYGSMQLHNYGTPETIMAYNAWGSSSKIGDIGIGSQPTGHPDWTFANNAAQYEIANLIVLAELDKEGAMFIVK